jgi:hypothetical protein
MAPSSFLLLIVTGCASLPTEPLAGATAGSLERVLSPGCAGSPYTSVQAALDAAVDGDVVEVCPGTWYERLVIDGKALTLRSLAGADLTTVDAQTWGRALQIRGGADVTVEGLTFANGRGGDGGNVTCDDSALRLRDSVSRNGEAGSGGGLSAVNCVGLVERTTFHDNLATWSGGGAFVVGDDFAVTDDTFRDNDADDQGGGLYLEGSGLVGDDTFEGNRANHGGGAYVLNGWGELRDNVVSANTSSDDGAGIYVFGGAPTVVGNTFVDNDSDDEAGGLRVKLSAAEVRRNSFVNNHADYRGGAVKVSHGDSVLEGNTYDGNSTWVTAGAVLLYESGSTLRDETFLDNTAAVDGGAVAVLSGWLPVTISDSTFQGNHADDRGGHLVVEAPGTRVTLRRLSLDGGEADRGGALYATDTELQIDNVLLTSNTAAVSGGAMYLDGVAGTLANDVFMWNSSPQGSAVTFADPAGLDVVNTVFRLSTTGAAVRLLSGLAPTFRYDDFSGNSRNVSGMPSPIGTNGNLTVAPSFVNAAGGDFRLRPTSGLVDRGDPAITDPNGSRSDLGIYGGPHSW